MKQTNKSAVGTSFHGHTIKATVNQLKKVLGKPVFSDNDGTDKVNFEWNMETSSGDVFSVYDWKEYRPLNAEEIISWHIGGKKPSVTELAQTEVEAALKSAAATPSPLPETAKKVITKNGEVLPMNEAETEVMYKGEWCSIQEDQDGEFYFLSGGKVFYIEMPESDPSIEELEKDLWNQPTGAPPTGKTETGVTKSVEWFMALPVSKRIELANKYFPEYKHDGTDLEDSEIHQVYLKETGTPLTPGNEREDSGEWFTPGEWKTGSELPGDEYNCCILNSDGRLLAQTFTNPYFSVEQAEANARLIASAPAMLKIVNRAHFWFNNEANYPEGTEGYKMAKECKAILNSITGGK